VAQEKDRPWRSAKYVNIRFPKTAKVMTLGVWGRPHPTEVDEEDGSEYLDLRTLEWDEVFGDEEDEDT
jgi:hypothetical protein